MVKNTVPTSSCHAMAEGSNHAKIGAECFAHLDFARECACTRLGVTKFSKTLSNYGTE